MSSLKRRIKKDEKSSCGHQFLDCLKFLYCEAMRLELHVLTDILEKTFQECAAVLKKEGIPIANNSQAMVEFHFLKEFRRLDRDQQLLLIEGIQRAEDLKTKH